jgi:hypothetical protein
MRLVALILSALSLGALSHDIDNLRDYRYCELLTMSGFSHFKIRMNVYNTIELNNCPAETWEALKADVPSLKKQFKTPLVVMNGPRYWVIDNMQNSSMLNDVLYNLRNLFIF